MLHSIAQTEVQRQSSVVGWRRYIFLGSQFIRGELLSDNISEQLGGADEIIIHHMMRAEHSVLLRSHLCK